MKNCHQGTPGSRGLSRSAVSTPAKPSSLWPRNMFQKLSIACALGLLGSSASAASACDIAAFHCCLEARTCAFAKWAHASSG